LLRGNEGSEGEFLCCAFGAEKRERVEKREREREREREEREERGRDAFFLLLRNSSLSCFFRSLLSLSSWKSFLRLKKRTA